MNVKNPYDDTPYDRLSVPDDAALGLFTPESRQKDVTTRVGLLLKARVRDAHQLTEARKALGFPNRIEVDAFLRSTLSYAREIDSLITMIDQAPTVPQPPLDWLAPLTFLLDPLPPASLARQGGKLPQLSHYSDPRLDLLAVPFDR